MVQLQSKSKSKWQAPCEEIDLPSNNSAIALLIALRYLIDGWYDTCLLSFSLTLLSTLHVRLRTLTYINQAHLANFKSQRGYRLIDYTDKMFLTFPVYPLSSEKQQAGEDNYQQTSPNNRTLTHHRLYSVRLWQTLLLPQKVWGFGFSYLPIPFPTVHVA